MGLLRIIRDVLHINFFARFDKERSIIQIVLNRPAPHAQPLSFALQRLLASTHIGVLFGET